MDTIETVDSVYKDRKLSPREREFKIGDMIKKADLQGKIEKIEILDPDELVKINIER